MARFFQEIDANGDGIVERKELEDFVTSYGFEKTVFMKAFDAMDSDKDGKQVKTEDLMGKFSIMMEQFNKERDERRLKKRLKKQKQKEGKDSGKENEMPEEKCDKDSVETAPVKQVTHQRLMNCCTMQHTMPLHVALHHIGASLMSPHLICQ